MVFRLLSTTRAPLFWLYLRPLWEHVHGMTHTDVKLRSMFIALTKTSVMMANSMPDDLRLEGNERR